MGRELNVLEKGDDPLEELYEELLEPDREKITFAMLSLHLGSRLLSCCPGR